MLGRIGVFLFLAAGPGCTAELEALSFGTPTPDERLTGQELVEFLESSIVNSQQIAPAHLYSAEYFGPSGAYIIWFSRNRKHAGSGAYQQEFTGRWEVRDGALCREAQVALENACTHVYRRDGRVFFTPTTSTEIYAYSTQVKHTKHAIMTLTPKPAPPGPVSPPTPAPPSVAAGQVPSHPRKKLRLVGSGSGFFVSSDAHVLTNDHVVEKCAEVTVRIDDQHLRAVIGPRDGRNDLALLRLPAMDYPIAIFRSNAGPYAGDSVAAIGYPLSDILASEGNVSIGYVSALAGLGNDASLLQISTPIQPGNSGGPLFDMSAHVVGVIVAGLGKKFFEFDGTLPQNVNFAIKASVAMAFLEASGVRYQAGNSAGDLRPTDVARKGKPVTVLIQCWG